MQYYGIYYCKKSIYKCVHAIPAVLFKGQVYIVSWESRSEVDVTNFHFRLYETGAQRS